MKKKIIGFVSVGIFAMGLYMNQAHGASAQDQYNEAVVQACESAKDLAHDVMIVRQTPITEAEQIQMIKDVGVTKTAEENGIRIVQLAHVKPLVESRMVGAVATSFGYEIQAKCLKDMTGTIL